MRHEPIRPRIVLPALQMKILDDTLARQAVDLFMLEVQKVSPKVLDEFAEVPSVFLPRPAPPQPPMSPAKRLPPEFTAWASRHHLKSVYVSGWAFRTLVQWRRQPELRDQRKWTTTHWGTLDFNDDMNPEYPSSEALKRRPPEEPLEAFPTVENQQDFMTRAERHWRARYKALLDTGLYEPVKVANARDLEWLARFVVGGDNFSKLAASAGANLKPSTVATGVKRAARLLGITLRDSLGGRPKSRHLR